MDSREIRRKNRRKAQQRCRIIVAFLFALFIFLAVFAGLFLNKVLGDAESEKETIAYRTDLITEMLESEEEIVLPEEVPAVKEVSKEDKLEELVEETVNAMSLEDKVAGLFIVTPENITGVSKAIKAGESTKQALEKYKVGGIIYSKKNIESPEQFKEMVANTKNFSKAPLFIAIKEEGGSIGSFTATGLLKMHTPSEIGIIGSTEEAYNSGVEIGNILSEYGFNMNLAPSADIAFSNTSTMVKRSYGQSFETAFPLVEQVIDGMKSKNVTAVVKHFPGIGSSTEDTSSGTIVLNRTREEFEENDFPMFKALIDSNAKAIMVAHVAAPSLTEENNLSCSFSPKVITDILRNELGFDGIIISDDMNLSSITTYYASDEAAIMALKAGCDMIQSPENFEEAYKGVLKAVEDGIISIDRINDTLKRIYRIKLENEITE